MKWWTEARFGMFIHWGLYALPARHEWVSFNERMTEEDYRRYFEQFNPDLYDPKEWARQAKAAGMKYVVVTAKHHDGFCLFDSKHTDYKATERPAARTSSLRWSRPCAPRGSRSGSTTRSWTGTIPSTPSTASIPRPRRQVLPRGNQGPRHQEVRRLYARPGPRAADRVTAGSITCSWIFPSPAKTARAGPTGSPRSSWP